MTDPDRELGRMAWPELAARRPILLVPSGSCEQHGPHLPLDTDTRIAVAVARAAAARLGDRAVVAPAIGIGASGEHAGFPGTLSIGEAAVELVVTELVRSADHFAGVLVVNAHGGNARALQRAAAVADHDGRRLAVWHAAIPHADAHAGRAETSLLLALAPDQVRTRGAEPGNVAPIATLLDELVAHGVGAVSANGVLGDPRGASADEGRKLLAGLVASLVERFVVADRSWSAP